MKQDLDLIDAELTALRARVERLEAACRLLVELSHDSGEFDTPAYRQKFGQAVAIARAALEPTPAASRG